MSIHDAYARRTPYELLLPDETWPDRHFPAVEEEGQERGLSPWNPAAFVLLGATAGALEDIQPDDAPLGSIHDHGSLIYHAYHIWRAGGPVVLVRHETLKGLLQDPQPGTTEWTEPLKGNAGYIQLPQHLVWLDAGGETEGAPESVDGLLWVGAPDGVLNVSLACGVRIGRPGLSVVTVPPQPMLALEDWALGPAREDGADFGTNMPGGEIEGLLGVRTPAEVLKLAALILRELAAGTEVATAPPPAALGEPSAPAPTKLEYALL
ncbi:MAG: hypothetical protein ACR2QM_12415 [Longimicrobiales bacterium]